MLLCNRRSSSGARVLLVLAWLAGLLGVAPVTPAYAATRIVPDTYSTIQAAINAASSGDTILVRAGTYSENLTLNKSLILTAASYDTSDPTRNTTIINGRSSRPTITIPAGVSPMPTVRGFVIQNGLDGIMTASEAVIEYNYFIASTDQLDYTAGSGGINRYNVYFNSQDDAIDLDNMSRPLLIENNRMMYNKDDGIEVRLQDASAPAQPITITIRNNEIIGCDEDGIQFIDYAQAVDTRRNFTVTSNLIANCRFAGIGLMGNTISVENYSGADILETIRAFNNTLYGNHYGISGGDNLIAYNNIIANSTAKGVWRVKGSAGASSIVAYTLFYNNGLDADQSTLGAGNLFGQNPLFASVPNAGPDGAWRTVDDDFSGLALQSGSPAIDAGYDPVCPATDLQGVARPQGAHCDLGAFEGPAVTPPPGQPTLVSPNGDIGKNYSPTYTWNEASGAIWYDLWVNGPSGNVINKWYQAAAVCNAGTCSVTPAVTLRGGTHTWWVQGWNPGGYGPWSSGMTFTTALPGAATLVSPNGDIGQDYSPAYTWNAVADVTWYYLWVNGPSGKVHDQWYQASSLCSGGMCSVTPNVTLGGGNHKWWIQTWNSAGYGPWSTGMSFSTTLPPPPGQAMLVSPNGSISINNPTYSWNTVSDATWYYLYVSGPSGFVFAEWYRASDFCDASSCSVANVTSNLGSGPYRWWVQTWNNTGGYGPWSSGMDFTVSP